MYFIGARSSRGRKKTDLHVGPCGPCVKCGKEHDTRWFHGKSLKAPAFRAMQREVPTVTDQSCICQACNTWSRRPRTTKLTAATSQTTTAQTVTARTESGAALATQTPSEGRNSSKSQERRRYGREHCTQSTEC